MALLKLVRRLDSVDWDFPRAGTQKSSLHRIHWFPGNFIPQIPSALIQILSQPGDVVFDPFSGSGTTQVEAILQGRMAVASDRNRVCVLIGQAKVALARRTLRREFLDPIISTLTFEQLCRTEKIGLNGEGAMSSLSGWYSPDTLAQLRFIWSIVEQHKGDEFSVLVALFSDLLFECASTGGSKTRNQGDRRHHWGWVADNVRPTSPLDHNAIAKFRYRIVALKELVDQSGILDAGLLGDACSLIQDVRNLAIKNNSIDLVVTSPPYIGMIDYTHANRLAYNWMGWSMEVDREAEIGARYRRNRKLAFQEYIDQMIQARDEIQRVCKPGAYCAVVIGESRKFPGTVDRLVQEFSTKMPLVWGPRARFPSRRRVSERSARTATEHICLFQAQ